MDRKQSPDMTQRPKQLDRPEFPYTRNERTEHEQPKAKLATVTHQWKRTLTTCNDNLNILVDGITISLIVNYYDMFEH